jgi:DNA-binding Xre family transcriptional regulator
MSTVVNKEVEVLSVDISDVAYIKWNAEKIDIVKKAMEEKGGKRGSMSTRTLAQALQDRGIACSYQNIFKLLSGKYSIISLEIAQGICEVLSIPVQEIVKIYRFSVYDG